MNATPLDVHDGDERPSRNGPTACAACWSSISSVMPSGTYTNVPGAMALCERGSERKPQTYEHQHQCEHERSLVGQNTRLLSCGTQATRGREGAVAGQGGTRTLGTERAAMLEEERKHRRRRQTIPTPRASSPAHRASLRGAGCRDGPSRATQMGTSRTTKYEKKEDKR